jgi:hypothetical protein
LQRARDHFAEGLTKMIMIWSVINLIHAAQLILAIGLSSSAATRLFFWLRRSESRKTLFENGQRYQDEDGDASEESLKSFSDRWPRALFATHAFVGSLAGFGLVVIGSRNRLSIDRVVQFGIWVRGIFLVLGFSSTND